MINSSIALKKYSQITKSKKRIDFPITDSFAKVISSDAYSAEGLNIHLLIFDELHAQKKRDLWNSLRYGGAARSQSLIASITTAGWDETTICYEQYDYAKKVLSGSIIDINFFPLIYEADKEDDILDPITWEKANPSLGHTISYRDMKQMAQEAINSPIKLNSFMRYKLNIWTAQAERWITPEDWKKCSKVQDPVTWREEQILSGGECYAGLDLGTSSDMTALVLFFPETNIFLPWYWCPESVLKDKKNKNRELYTLWKDQGFLTVTDGNTTDYDKVRADINEIGELFYIIDIALDRYFQGHQLGSQLMQDGFEVFSFGQGFASMAAPCAEFEERVIAGKFEHGNNPILMWNVNNSTVSFNPSGNIKPVKPDRNSPHKIDGCVSGIMALGRAMINAETPDDGKIF